MLSAAVPRRRQIVQPYDGPLCPRCDAKLTKDWIRSGIIVCPDCGGTFEATAFEPPPPVLHVAPVGGGIEGESAACANHARNAAVTNCTRCGLFICALCEMNVGGGALCPACFDRVRAEGALPSVATKIRDYGAMARVSAVVGLFFMFAFIGPLLGILSLVYQARARKQRRATGEPVWGLGPVVVLILSIIVLVGGTAMDGLMIWSLFFSK
jgi:ribosomal protein L37AE/L43A